MTSRDSERNFSGFPMSSIIREISNFRQKVSGEKKQSFHKCCEMPKLRISPVLVKSDSVLQETYETRRDVDNVSLIFFCNILFSNLGFSVNRFLFSSA